MTIFESEILYKSINSLSDFFEIKLEFLIEFSTSNLLLDSMKVSFLKVE